MLILDFPMKNNFLQKFGCSWIGNIEKFFEDFILLGAMNHATRVNIFIEICIGASRLYIIII